MARVFVVVALAGCGSQPRPQEEHPVVTAVLQNDVTITSQFLAEGGDPNFKNSRGDPLLYIATGARGGFEVASIVVLAGADVNLGNAAGRTPLHNAAGWCILDIVQLLLENGGDVRSLDNEGKNVIDAVCSAPAERREPVLNALFDQS